MNEDDIPVIGVVPGRQSEPGLISVSKPDSPGSFPAVLFAVKYVPNEHMLSTSIYVLAMSMQCRC